MDECRNFSKNKAQCNCTYEPCGRKGYCCECLAYHIEREELPACYFSVKTESTYDRSINNFIKDKRMTNA